MLTTWSNEPLVSWTRTVTEPLYSDALRSDELCDRRSTTKSRFLL